MRRLKQNAKLHRKPVEASLQKERQASPTPGARARGRLARKPMRKVEMREEAAVAVMRLVCSASCKGALP